MSYYDNAQSGTYNTFGIKSSHPHSYPSQATNLISTIMPNVNINYKMANVNYSQQTLTIDGSNSTSQEPQLHSWLNYPPTSDRGDQNLRDRQSYSLPSNCSGHPALLSAIVPPTIRSSLTDAISRIHSDQGSSSSPSNESIDNQNVITSSSLPVITSKLEGYVAGGHVASPIDTTHDEQIVVVDDDQYDGQHLQMAALRDLRQMGDYGSTTLRDAMASIGFQRSVTSQLLCRPGMDSVDMEERSPSPVAVRAPIKRDRSEIGKKMHCLVCETLTTGFHFGAVSCAACSAFFRRTIAERREYTCRKEGPEHLQCPINSEQRCYCRACRLQKCLRVGMDPLAVQPHRDNIGQKRKSSSGNGNTPPPVLLKNGHWQQQSSSPSAQNPNESLVDHLNMNRKLAAAVKRSIDTESPSGDNKKISATAQLLTSPNAFAEQLLAFSRTPVISSKRGSPSPKISTNADQLFTDSSSERIQPQPVPGPAPNDPPPPAQPPQSTAEERKPPPMQQHNQMEVTEDDYIVYEYEEELGGDPISRVDIPLGSMNEFAEGACDSRNYNSAENVVEQMVTAYQQLTERRRLLYCPGTIRDILSGTPPTARPAGIGERMQKSSLRVEVGLVAEFLSVLTPFTDMDLEDKIAVFKNLSVPYSILEKHYVTMKKGGLQQNRIIHNDNTYIDLSDNADASTVFIEGKPDDDKIDKETLKKLFVNPLRESLNEVTGAMFNMKMTDVEFCSLIAVLLFDPATPGLSDTTRSHVKQARDRVYHDWFSYYKSRGVHDASQKVGNTMLLLPAVQATAEKAQENYHLIRVFDLFEYDKILDEMMG